jgi:DNA-binding response OmpR family regulator
MHVLLIEDSLDLSANVGEFLESRGHSVDYARDGDSGLGLACGDAHDVIVLDIGLPGLDGLSLCRRLRATCRRDVPVLMLTARDTEADKLEGFEVGTDDYLTKPFSLMELLARLTALVRRVTGTKGLLEVADLTFDTRTCVIQRGARLIHLGPIGMRMLELLMRAAPNVVSRRQLERHVWGDDAPESDGALRVHILSIRNAVDAPGETKLLHNVHGVGYRLGA